MIQLNGKKICIVGTGGFGREVLCCLIDIFSKDRNRVQEIASFMVGDEYYKEDEIMNIPVIKESEFDPNLYKVVIAIGDPLARRNVVERLSGKTEYCTLIHPTAVLSEWVEIGEGSIITAGTILTCNIKIGKHAHLNLSTTVGHDCEIGDYFTTAPGVNISGNCKMGRSVYFGTGSSVKQGISITDNVIIGMGAVVVKHISEEGVYVGNPAKMLQR